ncbi:MAG: cupin domain-containing protein [Caenispirillum bisanense]|uniref:Transcriptional regulator, XRE family with cupin sensor n=1 Tax=Caenispirillum bisanense TaxID=414052 RepID=A0A286GWV9_9PROT|nr:cupin domain-containing protein [Caenispirillum bisanense]MCA1941006.1 cupin domain-containing protein [Caenispirillum bisanense]SOD99983.1 transcriptional regulator, XRE family with cupin sensor [Caenispirillum bisanense]
MDFDVGARLRAIREQNGLSQRQLAQRAGVTNGTISLIEQNRNSPSVASLRKVLQGIPMSLAEFFSTEMPPREKIVFKPSDLVQLTTEIGKAGKGRVLYRQVGDLRNRTLQILHETYEPGADTGRTMLQHASEEGGIVISGRFELTVGDQKDILEPGDSYLFDSRQPHRFRNPFDEPCVIISACTPPYL